MAATVSLFAQRVSSDPHDSRSIPLGVARVDGERIHTELVPDELEIGGLLVHAESDRSRR